jgi:hypothetical protein
VAALALDRRTLRGDASPRRRAQDPIIARKTARGKNSVMLPKMMTFSHSLAFRKSLFMAHLLAFRTYPLSTVTA